MKRSKKISNRHSREHDDAWHPRDWYYHSSHSYGVRCRFDRSAEAHKFLSSQGADYSMYHQSNEGSGFVYPKKCDILIGDYGPLEFRIRVWPPGLGGYQFIGEIKEREADPDMLDLPGRKSPVDANKYFAKGQHFYCANLEEFKEAWSAALEEYAIPMRSRPRRSRAKKDGYEYFRTKDQLGESTHRVSKYSLRRLLSESLKGNPRRKSEYYTKLMTLMKSEESFFQAESLFEMVQDTMLPEEVTILRAYFDTVDLARELYNAWTEYKIARDQAWENLPEKREVYARVQQRFSRKLVTVEQLLYHKKVYRVVLSISSKIIDGKL